LLDFPRSLDALDRIDEGIFALDHDGRFTYLNSTAQRLLPGLTGARDSDLSNTVIWDASPSFADTPAGRALRRAQEEGVEVVHEVRDPVSGSMLELRAYPSAGGLSVLLLEPAAAQAAGILDAMSDLYLACDHDWRLTLLNARAGQYLRHIGRSRDEVLGQSVWEVVPGLNGSRFQAEAFRAVVEQTEIEFESFFAPMSRWFSVRLTPMPQGIVARVSDLTGRRRPLSAGQGRDRGPLQEEKYRFQRLVESIDDVVFQLDTEQRCVNVFAAGWSARDSSPSSSSGALRVTYWVPLKLPSTRRPICARWPARR
jgi:PAS domain-containing protein